MTQNQVEKARACLEAELALLDKLIETDLIGYVGHIDGRDIYTDDNAPMEKRRAAFVKVFGKDEMQYYYISSGELHVNYKHESGVHAIHRNRDVDSSLSSVSDGKCHIETVTETRQKVVCDIEDTDI